MRLNGLRFVTKQLRGEPLGAETSINKLIRARIEIESGRLARDIEGTFGALAQKSPHAVDNGRWQKIMLSWPPFVIGGGTPNIQKNVIAERMLGLAARRLNASVARPSFSWRVTGVQRSFVAVTPARARARAVVVAASRRARPAGISHDKRARAQACASRGACREVVATPRRFGVRVRVRARRCAARAVVRTRLQCCTPAVTAARGARAWRDSCDSASLPLPTRKVDAWKPRCESSNRESRPSPDTAECRQPLRASERDGRRGPATAPAAGARRRASGRVSEAAARRGRRADELGHGRPARRVPTLPSRQARLLPDLRPLSRARRHHGQPARARSAVAHRAPEGRAARAHADRLEATLGRAPGEDEIAGGAEDRPREAPHDGLRDRLRHGLGRGSADGRRSAVRRRASHARPRERSAARPSSVASAPAS